MSTRPRMSEIVIPEGVDKMYTLTCSFTGLTTSLLDENGMYNVLMFVADCSGEHRLTTLVISAVHPE